MGEIEVLEPGQLSLFELADIANREHALARESAVSFLEHAWLAGEALLVAKTKVEHGDWLPWLTENFDATERTAQMYMRIAKTKRVSHLEEPSLRKALAAISASDERSKREKKLREERQRAIEEARAVSRTWTVEQADVHTWRPEGVDAIVTDPPYITADAIDLYAALADFAVDVLPDGGALVTMTWQPILEDVLHAMRRPELAFRWVIAWLFDLRGARTFDMSRRVFDGWKPILVYHKGEMLDDAPSIYDIVESPGRGLEEREHIWQQAMEGVARLVNYASVPGDTICDPFCGSGTTGIAALQHHRDFIGADVDETAIATTRAALAGSEE